MRVVAFVAFIVFISLCFTHGATAQNRDFFKSDDKRFYGGLVAGINISALDGDYYQGFHKLGLNAGGVVYARFSKRFGTSVSLQYSRKGTTGVRVWESMYIGQFIEKYYAKLNYVELPVLIHYLKHPKLHVGIGASYGRLLSSSEELLTDQLVYIDPQRYYFNREEISGIGQFAYQLGKNLFGDVRFQCSWNSVRDWANVHPRVGAGGNQHNTAFSFRLMYLIK